MKCPCGKEFAQLKVFAERGIMRVDYKCRGCYQSSEDPVGSTVNDQTIGDLSHFISALITSATTKVM